MLSVEKIDFSYGPRQLFQGLSCTVAQGSVVSMVGPSGIGKSTLAKIIAGHLRPDAGRILVNSDDVTGQPSRRVFMVSQENDLFSWQTVREHVDFVQPLTRRGPALSTSEILETVSLEKVPEHYPKALSGGMQKRLALARALALSPDVLVLDEVFSSQDEALRQSILLPLKKHWKKLGTIVVLVTHDAGLISGLADGSIAVM